MRYILFILVMAMLPVTGFAGGFIDMQFRSYKYVNDPNGIDMRSYGMLGPVTSYIVIIYPAKSISHVRDGINGSLTPQYILTKGSLNISNARHLEIIKIKKSIMDWFSKNKKPLKISFTKIRTNKTYKIPLPDGIYYLQYLIEFKKTRLNSLKSYQGITGPNFTKDEFGEYSSSSKWGECKVSIAGNTVQVTFKPNGLGMQGENFNNFCKYLVSTGEWDD